jgi:lysophospholipase L1-like esterase
MNIQTNTTRILCYGDSLPWGYKPATKHERLPSNVRWTGILQKLLGESYEVIEEGLNSRTLNSDDIRPGKEGRNGAETLITILDTHDPIDLVILMLGTNELKDAFETPIEEITKVLEEKYVKVILNRESQFRGTKPKLLLISPPKLDISKEYAQKRYSKSEAKSNMMEQLYQEISERNSCTFLRASKVVEPAEDGVHMNEENHKTLAREISTRIEMSLA